MILIPNTEIVKLFYDKTIEANTTEFIEVGCYEGSASKHLSTEMPNCKVTAYEANPVNFAHFSKELNLYNINYVNKAICEYDGETIFHLLDPLKRNLKSSLSKRTKAKKLHLYQLNVIHLIHCIITMIIHTHYGLMLKVTDMKYYKVLLNY